MSLLNSIGHGPGAWATAAVKVKAFSRVDSNDDRAIDKTELQAAFDAVAAKTGETARDAEAVIAKVDRNGDGAITRHELRAHMRDLRPSAGSTVELASRAGDAASR